MSCAGRFKKVEGGGLPAVTNYDYPDTNLAIRGTQDRSFQFEEVCTNSHYLFEEKTVNGNLLYTGSILDSEKHLVNRQPVAQAAYSGWLTAGTTVYDLPFSGAYHGGDYDSLGALTGEFWAAPRAGTHSPVFISLAPPGDNVGILQTGITLTGDTRHQLYGDFQCIYSRTGIRMDFWIEGYIAPASSVPVAFYNNQTRVWQATKPTDNIAVTSSPTEVSYDFTTSNFPGSTPTEYTIRAQVSGADTFSDSDATAAFVQVDSIHLDQYMQKNAFTDVIMPSGYLIQMTPDLGWHDTLSMFGEREAPPNPHLSTLGPFSAASGMVDNQDGSATITISDTEFQDATSNNYRKYLWRTIAISENGAPGDVGFPRRFTYLGRVFDEEFSVDKVWDDPLSITKLITGTKSRRMSVLVDGVTHVGMEYPTDNSWKLTIVMDAPTKHISIQGKDKGGALTSEHFIDLTSTTIGLSEKALWNVFDEHGLLLGVERLPDEVNEDYAIRMKDAYQNPGSHFFKGVVDGATRELGLDKHPTALTLSYKSRQTPSPLSLTADITSSSVLLRTTDLVYTETVLIDPVDLTCALTERISDDPTLAEVVDGSRVNIDQITYFDEKAERPDFRKVKFADESLGGKLVTLTYPYYREYTFNDYPTLSTLIPALSAYTDLLGNALILVTLIPELSGFEPSEGLYIKQTNVVPGAYIEFGWSPVHLKKIGDRLYRESFRNLDGTLWNTKFYKWITELKSNTNIEWGHVIADKAFWDAADNKLDGFDHLPTLMDPAIANYVHPSGQKIDPEEVLARGYLDEVGSVLKSTLLIPQDFVPGVAYVPDLLPTIHATVSAAPEIADVPDVVVGRTGNTPVTFFSGNIH